MHAQTKNKGFTLIELMIVIAIIGILAAIAVPQYSQYMNRSKFTEFVSSTASIKTAIVECYHWNAEGADICNTSTAQPNELNQVTADQLAQSATPDSIASITLTAAGDSPQITVTPSGSNGIPVAYTYILTGQVELNANGGSRHITGWVASGVGCDQGYC